MGNTESEEQISLTFDLPITNTKKDQEESKDKILFQLDDDVKEMSVNEPIEIIPITEANADGEKRYTLEEYETFESSLNAASPDTKTQDEVIFEKKTLPAEEEQRDPEEEIDPFNTPISELMKARADERRRMMKDFNYKFNNAKIDEIEKEPAYKRQGVNLDQAQHSSEENNSRMSLGTDDNDDLQLRSNNSFLHDNVD
jgi:cell division protein FtsZ